MHFETHTGVMLDVLESGILRHYTGGKWLLCVMNLSGVSPWWQQDRRQPMLSEFIENGGTEPIPCWKIINLILYSWYNLSLAQLRLSSCPVLSPNCKSETSTATCKALLLLLSAKMNPAPATLRGATPSTLPNCRPRERNFGSWLVNFKRVDAYSFTDLSFLPIRMILIRSKTVHHSTSN